MVSVWLDESNGYFIHVTVQRSSGITDDDFDAAESAIWDDCDGIRNCAYDHSEPKFFGNEMYGVNGESFDCLLLQKEYASSTSKSTTLKTKHTSSFPQLTRTHAQSPYRSKLPLPSHQG